MTRVAKTSPSPFTSNGTACQVVNLGFIAVDPPERIGAHRGMPTTMKRPTGGESAITARSGSPQDVRDRVEAEKLTPPSNVLRRMAQESQPPQEWWDEDFEGL